MFFLRIQDAAKCQVLYDTQSVNEAVENQLGNNERARETSKSNCNSIHYFITSSLPHNSASLSSHTGQVTHYSLSSQLYPELTPGLLKSHRASLDSLCRFRHDILLCLSRRGLSAGRPPCDRARTRPTEWRMCK